MRAASEMVAFILPAGLEHRDGWADFWTDRAPDEVIALGRVSYGGPGRSGSGGAMTDSSFYIWRKETLSTLWRGRWALSTMVGGKHTHGNAF